VKHCVGAAEREFASACYAACSDLARIKSTLKPAPELEKNRSISSITSYDRNRTFLFSSSRLNVGRRSCSRRRALFFLRSLARRIGIFECVQARLLD
jgi:hypothetical protein